MAGGIIKAAAALLALGVVGIGGWVGATRWRPSPQHYPLQGIDLSASSGPVEWGAVRAAGADFAYLVATDGARGRDAAFETNWNALPDAGLRRGAVHLFSMCESADAQANAFNTFVPRADDALPMAVDLSYRDGCANRPDRTALIGDVRRFAAMVEAHTGKPIILRVTERVESDYGIATAIDRPIWVVGNIVTPDYLPHAWRIWRASDFRRIDGIEGPVSWDVVAS